MIGALPFLPLDDVDQAWRFLKPTLPHDMGTFAKYVEDTWIVTSTTEPLFNQWSWNQWDATLAGRPRSSNIAEGWHNSFRTLVGCTNPTIWKFLDALKHLTREPLNLDRRNGSILISDWIPSWRTMMIIMIF